MGGFGERAGESIGQTIGIEVRVGERMRGVSGGDRAAHEEKGRGFYLCHSALNCTISTVSSDMPQHTARWLHNLASY
jgi:hypothetical protein